MLSFLPPTGARWTIQKPANGSDVWALQLNLNLLGANLNEDGAFGNLSETAVKEYQRKRFLTADGIAGPVTQKQMCLDCIAKFPQNLPTGLLRGVIEGESGYQVGCVNTSVPGGIDCGWTQDRVTALEFSDARFRRAFRSADAFPMLANQLDSAAKSFFGRPGAHTARDAWWCATLNWNWPAAAEQYAAGTANSWRYHSNYDPSLNIPDDGVFVRKNGDGTEVREYSLMSRAQWIIRIGAKGIQTGAQWASFYVSTKWKYIGSTWPTP